MSYYGSREWVKWIMDYVPEMMKTWNCPLFMRRTELGMWIKKLKRFGYEKEADSLTQFYDIGV